MLACCNCISPELMEALQMLKFLVSKGQGLSFIDGLDKDSEIMELEKQATDEVRTPEDIMAFIVSLNEFGEFE